METGGSQVCWVLWSFWMGMKEGSQMGLEEDSWMGLKEDFQMGLKEGSWVETRHDWQMAAGHKLHTVVS